MSPSLAATRPSLASRICLLALMAFALFTLRALAACTPDNDALRDVDVDVDAGAGDGARVPSAEPVLSNTPRATFVVTRGEGAKDLRVMTSNLFSEYDSLRGEFEQHWYGEIINEGNDTACKVDLGVEFRHASGTMLTKLLYVEVLGELLLDPSLAGTSCILPGQTAIVVGTDYTPGVIVRVADIAVVGITVSALRSGSREVATEVTMSLTVGDAGSGLNYVVSGAVKSLQSGDIDTRLLSVFVVDPMGLVVHEEVTSAERERGADPRAPRPYQVTLDFEQPIGRIRAIVTQ